MKIQTNSKSTMIECKKCKALNTKESDVCGSCGAKLEEHEGVRLVKVENEEKHPITRGELLEIIFCTLICLFYVTIGNMLINAIVGGICLYIARKRNSVALEIVAWLGIGFFLGTMALYAILSAWGLY